MANMFIAIPHKHSSGHELLPITDRSHASISQVITEFKRNVDEDDFAFDDMFIVSKRGVIKSVFVVEAGEQDD